jgi:hypothetical protein
MSGADAAGDLEVALLLAEARVAAGLPVGVVPRSDRTDRALALAGRVGAPLVPTLALARSAAADARVLRAEVGRASAEGRAVAVGLVLAPPLLGPATAGLITDAPWAFVGTAAGRSLLQLAFVLWLTGVAVVLGMVRAAGRLPSGTDDELLDLVAVAVRAGLGVAAAVRAAVELLPCGGGAGRVPDGRAFAWWLELGAVGDPPASWSDIAAPVAEAVRAGVPAAPLLAALAAHERERAVERARERAARLGARLALPTALLLLPAALLVIAGPLLVTALGLA